MFFPVYKYRWRCSKPDAKCSKPNWQEECDKRVKLSFCGGRYSEEISRCDQCETESEKEENKYDRFECYSDSEEEKLEEEDDESEYGSEYESED